VKYPLNWFSELHKAGKSLELTCCVRKMAKETLQCCSSLFLSGVYWRELGI